MNQSEQASINKYDLLFEGRLSKTEATCDALLRAVEKLERKINHNHYWTLSIMMGLIGVMAKGFHWI